MAVLSGCRLARAQRPELSCALRTLTPHTENERFLEVRSIAFVAKNCSIPRLSRSPSCDTAILPSKSRLQIDSTIVGVARPRNPFPVGLTSKSGRIPPDTRRADFRLGVSCRSESPLRPRPDETCVPSLSASAHSTGRFAVRPEPPKNCLLQLRIHTLFLNFL